MLKNHNKNREISIEIRRKSVQSSSVNNGKNIELIDVIDFSKRNEVIVSNIWFTVDDKRLKHHFRNRQMTVDRN